jgi:hypothetical protein
MEVLNPSQLCPRFPPHRTRRRWRARRQRGEARGGKQAAGKCDWPYPRSIGGGGSAGEVAGERRRRSRGGAATAARTVVKIGAWLNNVLHGKLPYGLGKVLGGPWAWRIGGGASSAMAVRRRPQKLGLRRVGSLVRPTRGCASSVGARRGSGRAQVARKVDGVMSSPRRRQWRTMVLGGGARARAAGPKTSLYTRGRSVGD